MIKLTRKVLCLDWDKRSLRIVVARVGSGRMVLEDAHSHRLPAELDADDPQTMGEFIRQMLRRHRLRFKSVLVDVPRERAVINRLALAPTPDAEVAAAVRFQAMRELPFPLETAAADYVETQRDEKGQTTEVLLAAVTLETLDRIRATCAAAGLTPARIGLRPYANLVSLRHVGDFDTRRVLFVDLGPGATEIDVFHGAALAFARSANVNVPVPASETGTHEDSRVISLAEIADLEGSEPAIAAAVDELLLEVTRTLTAYRATEAEAAIDTALVAGGTGIEEPFAAALHARLGYPVTLFDPTGPLGVDAGESAKLRSFSAALGLAWGLSREGLLALDFLNPKRVVSSRETWRRRARLIGVAVAVAAAFTAVGFGRLYWNLSTERTGLVSANEKTRKELNARTEIKDQIVRAQDWGVTAVWPDDLWRVADAAIEPGKKLLVQGIDMESGSRTQRMTLRNVYASDFGVSMDFVKALNELRVDGEQVYDVKPLAWVEIHNNPEFKGKLDIEIELRKLLRQQEEIQQRDKARKGIKRSR